MKSDGIQFPNDKEIKSLEEGESYAIHIWCARSR